MPVDPSSRQLRLTRLGCEQNCAVFNRWPSCQHRLKSSRKWERLLEWQRDANTNRPSVRALHHESRLASSAEVQHDSALVRERRHPATCAEGTNSARDADRLLWGVSGERQDSHSDLQWTEHQRG